MNQKTVVCAVVALLVGLGMTASAFAKKGGKETVQYTDYETIVGAPVEGGSDTGDDEAGVVNGEDKNVEVEIIIDLGSGDEDGDK